MTHDFTTANDGLLVAAARCGDSAAEREVVRRYRGPLLRVARSRLGDHQLAEDAVQEAFFNAFRWLDSYDSRYSFRTWLWTILLRACSRIAAARASRKWCWQPYAAACEQSLAVAAPQPLAQLLATEHAAILHQLLARLPEAQADALRLRFFGELKFDEIAAALGCSVATAKNRVKQGLLQLSAWLAESTRQK